MNTKTLMQLDGTVLHLNQNLEDKGIDQRYQVEPIAGTDNFSLWLDGHHIATAPSQTMYTIVYALKHVHNRI